MKRIALVVAPALAFALGACQSDGVIGPEFQLTVSDTLSAAVVSAADATADDIAVLNSLESSLGHAGPAGTGYAAFGASLTAWGAATGCAWSAAHTRFDCSTATSSGFTLTRTFAFYDTAGVAMPSFNAATTDSIAATATLEGIRTGPNGADTVSRSRTFSISGLFGANTTRTWNGTGTRTDGAWRIAGDVKRTAHVSENFTATNVVVQLPRTTNPWPMSGTVNRHVAGTGSVTKGNRTKTFTFDKVVTITFNGTANPTLTVDSKTFTVNLVTGEATEVAD